METFSPKERSVNIGKHKHILFNKKTVLTICKKRGHGVRFMQNLMPFQNPRTIKQLLAKFDNMKRYARKDASKQRQERFKTGGGPPPPLKCMKSGIYLYNKK